MPLPADLVETDVEVSATSRRFYRAVRSIFIAFYRTWLRMSVEGQENVPPTGAFILAPGGHRSILDTGVIAGTTKRMLRYMGAESYFAVPVLGWCLRSVGGFPVERDATDRSALRLAEAVLASGQPLVIFPESTRYSGPVVQPLKEGAAFLACRSGVPIVPVGIGGAERAWPKGAWLIRPTRVALVIGEPIMPPSRPDGGRAKRSEVRRLTNELHAALQTLFDRAEVAVGN